MGKDDPLIEALRPIAAALVVAVREETAKHAKGDEGPRYYDKDSAPMGPTAFLRLASQGAFPTFKVGKKVRARREDVHAWIESQEGARPRAPRPPPMARPLAPEEITTDMIGAAILQGQGVRPRDGSARRRDGPRTQRSPRK